MSILISYEAAKTLEIPWETIIENMVQLSLEQEACPFSAEVSVTITDDEGIRAINKEFRGLDTSTDVLSFPFQEFSVPGDFKALEKHSEAFNPETGELVLGDIILSQDHILRQAEEYGHSLTRELAFLVVHSMLHLMGYDHMEEGEREEMEQRQRAVLDKAGIFR